MSGTGRWLYSVAALATAALVLAGAGAADNSTTMAYSAFAFNDCNGETVAVEGTIHTEDHSTTSASGGTHIQFTINLSGVKGVAVLPLPPTGARYVESDTTTGSTNYSSDFFPSEFTFVETRILTRLGEDGTLDDFRYHLEAHMTFNANGVPTVDRTDSRIECR